MAELGPPGVKSTRAWVWDDLHGTHNLLAALARLEEACNSERGNGGGSARRNTPAIACASSSGRKKTRNKRAGVCEVRTRHRQGWVVM